MSAAIKAKKLATSQGGRGGNPVAAFQFLKGFWDTLPC